MSWPLSQDYNEAIQNPAISLADPDLKAGEPVVNAMGLPIPRSGNFADVYEFRGSDGKTWALKCFTRKVGDLGGRYAAIDKHLREAKLPFTVGFRFHEKGIRVRKNWYPMLQMEWVEGFTLNDFVRQHANRSDYLEALFLMWVRLAKRLRQADIAHSDLQHGNVLLVPGARASTLGLKLIDYDGMWVPELARRPSGEAGHSAYQHPARRQGAYSFDADRFPHLLIACALRALIVGGPDLWNRYDNGDNLLFREEDILRPGESDLVQSLRAMKDPIVSALLGHLLLAAKGPMSETPWLDHLMASEEVLALTPAQSREVARLLGGSGADIPVVSATAGKEGRPTPAKVADVFAALSANSTEVVEPRPATRTALSLYWLIPLGALLFGLLLLVLPIALLIMDRGSKSTATAPPSTEPAPPLPPTPQTEPPAAAAVASEPVIEPLTVMPRELPLPVLAAVWSVPGQAAPGCFEFMRNGQQLITSPGMSDSLILYDALNGNAANPMKGSVGTIRALRAAGENHAIIAGEDNVTAFWDLAFGQRVRNILVPEGELTPFDTSPNGMDALFAATDTWRVERYGLDTGMQNRHWEMSDEPRVVDVRYSPDGSRWVAVDAGSHIVIMGFNDGDKQINISDPSKSARRAILSKNGQRMLTFGRGAELRLWDTTSRKLIHRLPGHPGGVTDAVLSPNATWVFSVGADRMLRIWAVTSGREVQSHVLPEIASCVRIAPDERFVATASRGGPNARIQLWRIGDVKPPSN